MIITILLLGLLYFLLRSHFDKLRCATTKTQGTACATSPQTPFNNDEAQNHDRETKNRKSCSQATPYNTRTNAATLDLQPDRPWQHISVYCEGCKFHAPHRALARRTLYTNRPPLLLNTPLTHLQLLCITQLFLYLKCKSLCVRFYILILEFLLNLYAETVTVRFHSLPHCETNNRSQLQLSAYLSVPHSFEAFNPDSDAISLSQL